MAGHTCWAGFFVPFVLEVNMAKERLEMGREVKWNPTHWQVLFKWIQQVDVDILEYRDQLGYRI